MKLYLLTLLLLVSMILPAFGQEKEPTTDKFTVSGYLDLYYLYDFAEPANGQRQYVTQAARHNELNVNLGFVNIKYDNDRIRGNFALQAGTYATANYAAEPDQFAQLINQANIGVRIGEKTWIDAGVLSGHFGYEGLLSMNNELYTHALVTEYTPYFQTGVQLTHDFSEKLSFRVVVLNGYQIIADNNKQKSVGIGVDYQISDELAFSYGNYLGKDPSGFLNLNRFHQNAYLAWNKPRYTLAAVVDYMLAGWGDSPINTQSVLFLTFIQKYDLSEQWSVSGRYEYVVDEGNILFTTNFGFQTQSLAACLTRNVTENVLFRTEYRYFFSDRNIWNTPDGTAANTATVSMGLAMKFN